MVDEDEIEHPATVVIVGAGIVGLVLALSLKKHCGVTAEVYEKASGFQDDIGAGIGMYPNALRVVRNISPSLLNAIREAGHPYLYRRWMRHDGKEVTRAKEKVLCKKDDEIQSIGIRRWKLQKILFDAVVEEGITVEFGSTIDCVTKRGDGLAEIRFENGSKRLAKIVFGDDGCKSKVREAICGKTSKLEYTGVECLMGIANWARPSKGICFPSSCTTKCHACFFPTGNKEQCFQFHFPIPAEDADRHNWRPLNYDEGKEECHNLAKILRQDGWDESFLEPLENVANVVRIGFCLLKPRLLKWVDGPIILIGDAAHPPVPYIGQGAQMGIEDAGVVSLILKSLCVNDDDGSFNCNPWSSCFRDAMNIYETLRIPRTNDILENSITLGEKQQNRADSKSYNHIRESSLRFQVFFHGTLPIMFPGATYDFKEEVSKAIGEYRKNTSSLRRSRSTPSLRETTKDLIRRQAVLAKFSSTNIGPPNNNNRPVPPSPLLLSSSLSSPLPSKGIAMADSKKQLEGRRYSDRQLLPRDTATLEESPPTFGTHSYGGTSEVQMEPTMMPTKKKRRNSFLKKAGRRWRSLPNDINSNREDEQVKRNKIVQWQSIPNDIGKEGHQVQSYERESFTCNSPETEKTQENIQIRPQNDDKIIEEERLLQTTYYHRQKEEGGGGSTRQMSTVAKTAAAALIEPDIYNEKKKVEYRDDSSASTTLMTKNYINNISFRNRIEELERNWGVVIPTCSSSTSKDNKVCCYKERIEALEVIVFGKVQNDKDICMKDRIAALE